MQEIAFIDSSISFSAFGQSGFSSVAKRLAPVKGLLSTPSKFVDAVARTIASTFWWDTVDNLFKWDSQVI